MPINHRFHETDFGNGFQTHNAILDVVPYEPEVLFIGTYNPQTDVVDGADFFYGRWRSWFWPVLKNIFVLGTSHQLVRRIRDQNGELINPTLPEILQLSERLGITFADLIKRTLHHNNPNYVLKGNVVTFQGNIYNLIDDNALANLNTLNQVDWSTNDIVRYIQDTPSIKCVRLTRQPTGVWLQQWQQITNEIYGRSIDFGTIHTPAGMGLREKGINPAVGLARRWLFHPDAKKRFCDSWLNKHDVHKDNFHYPIPPLPLI